MLVRGILLLFCAVLCSAKQVGLKEYISHSFETNSDFPLLHIALNNRDGNVYLSCVNRLYQLNKNLDLSSLIEVVTGPVKDSDSCLPYGRECDASNLLLMNNYNKLLVPDIDRDRLLVCGSIYQGMCEARSISNISSVVSGNPGLHCQTNDCPLVSCLTEECTTIAVIAEGPTVYNPVLYVATTVVESVFLDFKNSVSTRSLHIDPTKENKLFLWTVDGQRAKSYAKYVDKDDYDKYFKYGFSTDGRDGFVYFVFQNKQKASGAMSTVIARVCKKDPFFLSHIEMTLTCEGIQQQYNGELVGAYFQKNVGKTDFNLPHSSQGALYVAYKNGTSSSLCIYTIEDLNNVFDDTIISCYRYAGRNAAGTSDIAKSGGVLSCDTTYLPVASDTTLDSSTVTIDKAPTLSYYPGYELEEGKIRCGASYLPQAIERFPAVESTWSYRQMGVNFSGVTVDLVQGINVAYIGTEEGQIIELDVNHKNNFNTIDIGKPVLSELILDKDASLSVPNLYAMTSSEVLHIKVSVCERHATCSECLEARDPYCGWCILRSSCLSLSSGCSSGWLKPLSQQCIEASTPEPLERTLQQDVVTKVKLLPALSVGNAYQCMFDGKEMTVATVDPSDSEIISCKAPTSEQLPKNLEGEDYVNVTLSILYNSDKTIVTTSATFYECQAHGRSLDQLQPCDSCLNNRWSDKCSWCVESHECMPRSTRSCMTTSNSCPKVTSAASGSQLLSVGVPTDIVVNVEGLPQSATDMKCRVEIGKGNLFETNAVAVDPSRTQIRCGRQTYKYSLEQIEVNASVTVYWASNYNLDNEITNPVSFYNCSIDYGDCSLCVTSLPKYNCGWCGDKCVVEQMCDRTWVKDPGQCPGPEIKSFSPKSGPISGNTMVTINGMNMGVEAGDVEMITVAGVPCQMQMDLYQVSNVIVCKTTSAPNKLDGKVSIIVRGFKQSSSESFYYRNPVLEKLSEPEGPVAGGIIISMNGTNLDTGLVKKAFIGTLPCEVQLPLRSGNVIECKTSAASQPMGNLTVSVEFDGFAVTLPYAFSYVKNPEITSFTTASKKLASFLAGGREIMFTGKRLHLVQNAKLIAFIPSNVFNDNMMDSKRKRRRRSVMKRVVSIMLHGRRHKRATTSYENFISDCTVINATHMKCPSPEVSLTYGDNFTKNVSDSMYAEASLRLIMDNVNLKLENDTLKYYPNPVVEDLDLDESKDYRSEDLLEIKVHNLNTDAIQDSEIIIMVADRRCRVSLINQGSVHCSLPAKPEGEENTFPVTVAMGSKFWSIGSVTYLEDSQPFPTATFLGIFIPIVLIVIGIVVFVFWYKQRRYKSNKNDFLKAVEDLEISVRADFRKAFAELSIDMTDLTADIGDVGLPILSYRQYATNMFFPSARYHVCMKEPNANDKPIPAVHQGFVQFDLLITNKQFLMSFIRTLEEQRGFSNRDKLNVASLITVVLHKKLDYFTEVMKSLISELVATSVQRNPKLVLRRTETVAERMFSNWLSICLFPYIRDTAGKPMFLLQKAIKHQVSKGALDAVTGKTRYTLSDDSLLKEDIPCEALTLFVSQSETDEPIIVKVLSCDSISQVKEKIMDAVYKRIPISQRPKTEQLDLEWRHGRSGHIILPDIDYANEPGSRWRRVLTIKDYKVENNATMALVEKLQNADDVVSQLTNQSADTSVVSPMLPDDNVKTYHLVKYTDDLEQKRESAILRDKHKHILELYLLRLINMKGILQSYVDEVFQAILETSSIPPAVKHIFDFLDELAKTNGIDDPEILHIWKTNSVLGRFWVTILKSPEAVFDIDKPESVESSMAVISQTFIDACSVLEHKPTKDSPINKQLYAKEIPNYKRMVQKYYQDVQSMQPVSDQDMSAHMTEISRSHNLEFDVHAAHNELWGYVNKYYEEIHETLSTDPNSTQMVIQRLQQAYTLIDSSINNP